jgi:cellulose synthase (UDP-forming)
MALLSCTFQEYPCTRIVLLIDNPPDPQSPNDKKLLDASRKLPEHIAGMLKPMHSIITKEWTQFESKKHQMNRAEAARVQTALFRDVATWFGNLSLEYPTHDHTELYFVKEILSKLASKCHLQAESLEYRAQKESASVNEIEYGYRYLHSLFSAELVSFERKTFENLSHEPNKAMNMNSYLGLLGKTFSITRVDEAKHKQCLLLDPLGTFVVPWADYVISLDADSILLTEYALRLVAYLEKPEHQHVALIQTPQKAFPKAPSLLERAAGATQDVYVLIQHGLTFYNASFWIGANGLLRMKALKDIEMIEYERGYPVLRYIQDRTVIEDTESTIDLIYKGWKLDNYPANFCYTATPPDFG